MLWIGFFVGMVMLFLVSVLIQLGYLELFVIMILYAITGILLIRILNNRKWKISAMIFEKRGHGHVVIMDQYRRVSDRGEEFGELRKKKTRIKPIPLEHITASEKGKPVCVVVSPHPGEYYSTTLDEASRLMKAQVDPFYINWRMQEARKADEKWQKEGLLSKIMVYLPLIIIVVSCTLMLVIFMDQLTRMTGPLLGVAGQMAEAGNNMAEAIKILNETGVLKKVAEVNTGQMIPLTTGG